jgi:multidrug efflux pump subunit AcrB
VKRLELEYADSAAAVVAAVARRTRPILMTTATTIAGLLPLTFTRSTLWPPLAWAIISGLLASTLLTLVVIPALYHLLVGRKRATPAAEPQGSA